MTTPWTNNPNWGTPIKRELCGRVSDRYIPCKNEKPCPVHDSSTTRVGDVPLFPPSPAPRLFEELTNQHGVLAMHNRKEGP